MSVVTKKVLSADVAFIRVSFSSGRASYAVLMTRDGCTYEPRGALMWRLLSELSRQSVLLTVPLLCRQTSFPFVSADAGPLVLDDDGSVEASEEAPTQEAAPKASAEVA